MDINWLQATAEAVILTIILGYIGLPLARRFKARQSIREEGPKSHRIKAGTPTMGGLSMMLALVLCIAWNRMSDPTVLWLLLITLGHCFLGFMDDFIKAEKKRNMGLTARQKMLGQIILSLLFCWGAVETLHMPTNLAIPFSSAELPLGWLYYPFVIFVIVGASNAVNLTDGLDGLAAGCCVIAFSAYSLLCYVKGNIDICLFAGILAGCCAGFLFFNYHPAKIFMGDTGSLALGGAIAGIAVLTKTELLLVFLGFIFVIEALSVIIQVISFQTTGKRVFKMSPLHHHFELSGWSELKVVWCFWGVEFAAAAAALILSV